MEMKTTVGINFAYIQSTIFVRLRGGRGKDNPVLSNREVRRIFEEWGTVKEIRDCRGNDLYISPLILLNDVCFLSFM